MRHASNRSNITLGMYVRTDEVCETATSNMQWMLKLSLSHYDDASKTLLHAGKQTPFGQLLAKFAYLNLPTCSDWMGAVSQRDRRLNCCTGAGLLECDGLRTLARPHAALITLTNVASRSV